MIFLKLVCLKVLTNYIFWLFQMYFINMHKNFSYSIRLALLNFHFLFAIYIHWLLCTFFVRLVLKICDVKAFFAFINVYYFLIWLVYSQFIFFYLTLNCRLNIANFFSLILFFENIRIVLFVQRIVIFMSKYCSWFIYYDSAALALIFTLIMVHIYVVMCDPVPVLQLKMHL